MSDKSNGGPAFPWDGMGDDGMTLRDYFAGQAMAAHMHALLTADTGGASNWHALIAKLSYETADAMLKERSK